MAIKLFAYSPEKGVDIASLLRDERLTISRTPMGASSPDERIVYVKRAVSWKGKKVKGVTKLDEKQAISEMVRAGIPEKIARALYQIAKDSRNLKGRVGGLYLVEFGGKRKIMTGPAVAKLAKKIYIAKGPEALNDLMVRPVETNRFIPGRLPAETFAKVSYDEIIQRVGLSAPAEKRLEPAIVV